MSTDLMTTQFADTRVLQAIELIWHEAALLDAKDYQAWDALWTDEGRYVIPIDPDTDDFDGSLNMVNDDTRMRRMRIERLTSGYSMSALAAARTVRTVSRFTVEERTEDSVTVRSAQILVGFKRDDQQTLAADVTHRIRYTESGPRLDLKVIRLVNSQAAVNASGYLL
ncbi:aromatic-ring-hydroxylating dioxygenase subunit beta [Rhodococcus oxybenzonivorans]|uniref:aromatic-ring-hydroxylating dioxygenase subunit beta n=1 Tax=Rhodococcus TaxID=1827 RepID=UPI0013201B49|nr:MULTISPECIES: aromatic-ring-hydroxylating dioxygenase subunit beta [Rhodococcus]MDV7356805.1 aromatic-ring-hydroxylating dioxygenase subunit beta [Rhodococcus oxybenzonivorans]QHE67452.1 Putative aromatic-ring-hydroxylating dioxygenase, beta subunit [Rhodococcus sp. WAY2]